MKMNQNGVLRNSQINPNPQTILNLINLSMFGWVYTTVNEMSREHLQQ